MIFSYIEEYIEFIAGYRDNKGIQVHWWPDIKLDLASYDVSFVMSVAEQTINSNIAMSTKQAALSEKLIEKYAKQLRKNGVEQPNHKNYRLGQREVNHISNVSRNGDQLFFRFPFNEKMISDIKSFVKEAQGNVSWSREDRAWVIAITEFNVSWIVCYAQHHHITVENDVLELYNLILEAEKIPYAIELRINDNKELYISNAPNSLTEYITKHIGFDNIYALVDSAGALGYTVSEEIASIMTAQHGKAFMKLCADRSIDLVPKKDNASAMLEIVEWAKIVDRFPIVVYNPNILTFDVSKFEEYFDKSTIQVIDMKNHSVIIDPNAKIVYTNKILDWQGRLPLLITYANLMHGTAKKRFLSAAEKIVYYCEALPKR